MDKINLKYPENDRLLNRGFAICSYCGSSLQEIEEKIKKAMGLTQKEEKDK